MSEGSFSGMSENRRDSVAGDKNTFNFIKEQCENNVLIVQIHISAFICKYPVLYFGIVLFNVSKYIEDIKFYHGHN